MIVTDLRRICQILNHNKDYKNHILIIKERMTDHPDEEAKAKLLCEKILALHLRNHLPPGAFMSIKKNLADNLFNSLKKE